ncbi:MAG: hypothetical protein GX040_11530 [Alcaligenaceae bacterium]|nr:hypothetical protein [Alcaligenaceae bacterium]
MNRQERDLHKQLLLARIEVEREIASLSFRKLSFSASPRALKQQFMQSGYLSLSRMTGIPSAVFGYLEKNPRLSLLVGRVLLRTSKTRSKVLKPVVLAAVSWFVYNKFQSRANNVSSRQPAPTNPDPSTESPPGF